MPLHFLKKKEPSPVIELPQFVRTAQKSLYVGNI
jgi:hypothetical protein